MMTRKEIYAARRAEEIDGVMVLAAAHGELVGGEALAGELEGLELYAVELEAADRRRLLGSGYDAVVYALDGRGRGRHYAVRYRPR